MFETWGYYLGRIVLGIGLLFGAVSWASEFAPKLSEKEFERLEEILQFGRKTHDLESGEREYQKVLSAQSLEDIEPFYDPSAQEKIEITFPNFIPEQNPKSGRDGGWGFHVVRRLTRELKDGKTRVTYVNEHWPEDKISSGLFLPIEIRIKTQIYDGPRKVAGSEKLFGYDSIRLAWKRGEVSPKVCRRTRFRYFKPTKENLSKPMRMPITAPYICSTCHSAGSQLSKLYSEKGETRNYEAIVQDSQFGKKVTEMPGYVAYVDHLVAKKRPDAFIADVKKALLDPKKTFAVPGLLEGLKKPAQDCWIEGDTEVSADEKSGQTPFEDQQGIYFSPAKKLFRDAIEAVFPGKYEEWEPAIRVP